MTKFDEAKQILQALSSNYSCRNQGLEDKSDVIFITSALKCVDKIIDGLKELEEKIDENKYSGTSK